MTTLTFFSTIQAFSNMFLLFPKLILVIIDNPSNFQDLLSFASNNRISFQSQNNLDYQ